MHGPVNGSRVGVVVGKDGKARVQASKQGSSPSGDGKEQGVPFQCSGPVQQCLQGPATATFRP